MKFYQVDAFADKVFAGNPAAVIIMDTFLPDDILQKIAIENNLSETAFLVKAEDYWKLRWFTPGYEVDLCGHATLASAHVLFNEGYGAKDSIQFATRSGILSVQQIDGQYEMIFPADITHPIAVPELLNAALGIPILTCLRGKDDYLVIVADESQVANLKPNFHVISKLDGRGVIVSAPGDQHDFVSRCFYPQAGVNEDPVTGSAHTLMIPYWTKKLGKEKLSARQISARGGNVRGWQVGEKVHLCGGAVTVLKGEFMVGENTN